MQVVQLDDPLMTYFCDPDYASGKKVLADTGRFGKVEDELDLAIRHINHVFEGVKARRVTIDGCDYREGLNAVRITGGVAGNVIPDECEIEVNFRFAPVRVAAVLLLP